MLHRGENNDSIANLWWNTTPKTENVESSFLEILTSFIFITSLSKVKDKITNSRVEYQLRFEIILIL